MLQSLNLQGRSNLDTTVRSYMNVEERTEAVSRSTRNNDQKLNHSVISAHHSELRYVGVSVRCVVLLLTISAMLFLWFCNRMAV